MSISRRTYHIHGEDLTFAQLHHKYFLIVKKAVASIRQRGTLPGYVDLDDLMQEGSIALMDAADRFKESVGVKFATYAYQRVYGQMVDHLRELDWAPRSTRAAKRKIEQAEHELVTMHRRVPTHKEIADHLGWSEDDLAQANAKARRTGVLSLDHSIGDDAPDESVLAHTIADPNADVGSQIESEEIRELIDRGVIDALNEQEQKVFILHFIDHKSLKAIAQDLSLSESRVSQIRNRAIRRMRDVLLDQRVAFRDHGVDLNELKPQS